MIQDMGNVELFELFETDPKTQCKEFPSCWSEGIVDSTCGHLLKESAANRGVIQYTLDFLSIPNYLIKKGRPHGHRYGKTPQQKEYHQAHFLKKRCIKKGYQGIHDRFLIDSEFRASQLEHDRDEEVCIKMGELSDKIQRKSIKKRMHAKRHDRMVKPVVSRLWIKPHTSDFHDLFFSSLFFAIGSFTADGGLLQPTACIKTTPQKTSFRSVNL